MNAVWRALPWLDNESPRSLSRRFRERRLSFFERVSAIQPGAAVLDIGGTPLSSFFSARPDLRVTFLNLYPAALAEVRENLLPGHAYAQGDAREIDLPNYAFDIAFSNSLLEHLDGPGQEAAAREIRRVARFHFVQVPYRYFPWEPHYNLPGIQFAPRRLQEIAWRRWPLSYGHRYSVPFEAINLPDVRRLKQLFPTSHINPERFGPLTKALYAWGPAEAP